MGTILYHNYSNNWSYNNCGGCERYDVFNGLLLKTRKKTCEKGESESYEKEKTSTIGS